MASTKAEVKAPGKYAIFVAFIGLVDGKICRKPMGFPHQINK
jgi:hypothetical protein